MATVKLLILGFALFIQGSNCVEKTFNVCDGSKGIYFTDPSDVFTLVSPGWPTQSYGMNLFCRFSARIGWKLSSTGAYRVRAYTEQDIQLELSNVQGNRCSNDFIKVRGSREGKRNRRYCGEDNFNLSSNKKRLTFYFRTDAGQEFAGFSIKAFPEAIEKA